MFLERITIAHFVEAEVQTESQSNVLNSNNYIVAQVSIDMRQVTNHMIQHIIYALLAGCSIELGLIYTIISPIAFRQLLPDCYIPLQLSICRSLTYHQIYSSGCTPTLWLQVNGFLAFDNDWLRIDDWG